MQSISQILNQVNTAQRNPSSFNESGKHNGLCPRNGDATMQPLLNQVSTQNIYKPYGDSSEKHKIANQVIAQFSYKGATERLLHELVSCCDCEGETRVTHDYLAAKLKVTRRTIINHMQKLKEDGVVTYSKNGWKQSNTTVLLCIKTKLINKCEKFSHDLNNLNNLKDLNNINHYSEYESFFSNSGNLESSIKYQKKCKGLNTPKSPQLAPENTSPLVKTIGDDPTQSTKEDKLLRSEWDVSRETLPDDLLGAIWRGFDDNQMHTIILTLKRLIAPLDAKLRVVGQLNQYAKLKHITNIGGFIVSKYKQIRDEPQESQHGGYQKPQYDPTEQLQREKNRLRQKELEEQITKDAEYYAVEQLEKCGIKNPRLTGNACLMNHQEKIKHYDDCKNYDEKLNHYLEFYKKSQLEQLGVNKK